MFKKYYRVCAHRTTYFREVFIKKGADHPQYLNEDVEELWPIPTWKTHALVKSYMEKQLCYYMVKRRHQCVRFL